MYKKFFYNIVIYGLSPSINKFVGVFLLPIYTKVFSPEEYGVIDLINIIVIFISISINLQIYSAVGRYYNQYRKLINKRKLISTAFWNIVGLSIIIVLLSFLLIKFLNLFDTSLSDFKYSIYIAVIWIPFCCLNTFLSVIIRYEKKPVVFLIINFLQLVVKVFTSIYTIIYLKLGATGLFLGYILGDITGVIILFVNFRKFIYFYYNLTILKKLLTFSLPLVPSVFLGYLNNIISRFIMIKNLSLHDIGIYAVALKIASVFLLIKQAFRMTWEPFIYEKLNLENNNNIIKNIYKVVLLICGFLILCIVLFAKDIIGLVAEIRFQSAYLVLGYLSLDYIIGILVLIITIGPKIAEKTIYNFYITTLSLIINTICLMLFIPKFGFIGVGYSLIVSGIGKLIISLYIADKTYTIDYPLTYTFISILIMFGFVFISNLIVITLTLKILILALSLIFISFSFIRLRYN